MGKSKRDLSRGPGTLSPDERAAYLEQACEGNLALRCAVESLIESHEESGNFVDVPAYQAAAEMLMEGKQLKEGQMVAHYRIVSLLGQGGMGQVYLAEDTKLHRKVSLKFLSTNLAHDRERTATLQQEARAISALNHPNTLTIHEISEGDGQTFIATEFIEGQTLRERLTSAIELDEALEIAIQVASVPEPPSINAFRSDFFKASSVPLPSIKSCTASTTARRSGTCSGFRT